MRQHYIVLPLYGPQCPASLSSITFFVLAFKSKSHPPQIRSPLSTATAYQLKRLTETMAVCTLPRSQNFHYECSLSPIFLPHQGLDFICGEQIHKIGDPDFCSPLDKLTSSCPAPALTGLQDGSYVYGAGNHDRILHIMPTPKNLRDSLVRQPRASSRASSVMADVAVRFSSLLGENKPTL